MQVFVKYETPGKVVAACCLIDGISAGGISTLLDRSVVVIRGVSIQV